MGNVLSILGIISAIYVFRINRGGGIGTSHDGETLTGIPYYCFSYRCAHIWFEDTQGTSERSNQQGHGAIQAQPSAMILGGATGVDARHATFNVTGAQHFHSDGKDTIRDMQERREIVNWLSPLNFKAVHGEILQIGQEGTGQWALESEEFQSWRNGSKEFLWCRGIREPYFLH